MNSAPSSSSTTQSICSTVREASEILSPPGPIVGCCLATIGWNLYHLLKAGPRQHPQALKCRLVAITSASFLAINTIGCHMVMGTCQERGEYSIPNPAFWEAPSDILLPNGDIVKP